MTVALDVKGIYGDMVLRANTIITTSHIKRILISGSGSVYIYSQPNEASKRVIIERDVENKQEMLRDEMFNISESREFNQTTLYEMITDAVGLAENMGGISKYLQIMKEKNEYTFTHSMSVGMMSNLYGKWMKLTGAEMNDLTVASSMHDVGKLSIDIELLDKPGKLTFDEFAAMKKHVDHGCELLEISKAPERIIRAVSEHHEKSDGSGYPHGKKRGDISVLGAMLAITDVYDALVSKRAYRDAMCPFKAMELMYKDRFGHFKFDFLDTFVENIVYAFMGAVVELSDGRVGEIVFVNPNDWLRPYIRIEGGEIFNMQSDPNVKIDKVIT